MKDSVPVTILFSALCCLLLFLNFSEIATAEPYYMKILPEEAMEEFKDYNIKKLKRARKQLRIRRKITYAAAMQTSITNTDKIAAYQQLTAVTDEVLKILAEVLKEKLRFGDCQPSESKFKIFIRNKSEHFLSGVLSPGNNPAINFFVEPGSMVKLTGRMTDMFVSDVYQTGIVLSEPANSSTDYWTEEIKKNSWRKKRKPCIFKFRYKIFNRSPFSAFMRK